MAAPNGIDKVRWATGASASKTDPPAARKDIGWRDDLKDKPPAEYVNSWWYEVYLFLFNWRTGAARYTDLQDATDDANLPTSATFVLNEYDLARQPGGQKSGQSLTSTQDMLSIDATGRSVVFSDSVATAAAHTWSYERDLATPIAAYIKTNAASPILRTISDGAYVLTCYGNYVECYDHDTGGAALWTYNHGAAVNDICTDGINCYLVGDLGTGNVHVRAIVLSSGLQAWAYRHTGAAGQLQSCCTNGRQVFVAGAASSYGSAANLRALKASNGYDAANEGGTGTDTDNLAWDAVATAAAARPGQLCTDGKRLYCTYDGGAGAYEISIRSCSAGPAASSAILTSLNWSNTYDPYSVCVDQDYLYCVAYDGVAGAGYIYCFDKRDLTVVWVKDHEIAATDEAIYCVATDGARVYAGLEAIAPGLVNVESIYRGNRPGPWVKVASTSQFLPYRWTAIPHEGA